MEAVLERSSGTNADWVEMAVKLSCASNWPGGRIWPGTVLKLSAEKPDPWGVKVADWSSGASGDNERLVSWSGGTKREEVTLVIPVVLVTVTPTLPFSRERRTNRPRLNSR